MKSKEKIGTDGVRGRGRGREKVGDKIRRAMFSREEERPQLTKHQEGMCQLYEHIFTVWLAHPYYSDSQLVDYVQRAYGRSERSAYRDIEQVKAIIGNVQNAGREFQRYRVIEMLLESYQLAKDAGDINAMIRAAGTLGKYTHLDKPAVDRIDWAQLTPPVFEPTADVRVLGIDPIEDVEEVRARLEAKYLNPSQGANPTMHENQTNNLTTEEDE